MNFSKLLIAIALLLSSEASFSAGIGWFSFASSLEPGEHWRVQEFDEGPEVLDLSVVRWDTGTGQWVGCRDSVTCTENAQSISWGVPVYSPLEGKVRACWRSGEDNPKIGVKHADLQSVNEDDWRIPNSGNSLFIETADGDMIKLTHLRKNSIPPSLCPKQGDEFDTAQGREKTPSGDYRVGMYLEPSDRPIIKKGDFVGFVGNSGNSTGPHLHIDRAVVDSPSSTGDRLPLRFARIWAQRWEKDRQAMPQSWYRFRGEEFMGYDPAEEPSPPNNGQPDLRCGSSIYQPNEPRCNYTMFNGSPFLRRVGATDLATSKDTSVTFLRDDLVVTAMKTSQDLLQLMSWRVDGFTKVTKLDAEMGGGVKQIAVTKVSATRILVATKLANDKLKMILYQVNSTTGNFTRLHEYLSNEIKGVQLTRIDGGDDKMATAIIGTDDHLKVIVWDVVNDKIVRLGSATGPVALKTRIAPTRNFRGVVTASKDYRGRLVLNSFTVSSNGQVVTKADEVVRGSVGDALSVVATQAALVAAYETPDGDMKLESFQLSSFSGAIGNLKGTESAGTASEIKLLNPSLAGGNLATIVKDGAGVLRVIGWTMNIDGSMLRRDGSSRDVAASYIDAATLTKSYEGVASRDLIVVTSRGPTGKFSLSTWDTNLNQ